MGKNAVKKKKKNSINTNDYKKKKKSLFFIYLILEKPFKSLYDPFIIIFKFTVSIMHVPPSILLSDHPQPPIFF